MGNTFSLCVELYRAAYSMRGTMPESYLTGQLTSCVRRFFPLQQAEKHTRSRFCELIKCLGEMPFGADAVASTLTAILSGNRLFPSSDHTSPTWTSLRRTFVQDVYNSLSRLHIASDPHSFPGYLNELIDLTTVQVLSDHFRSPDHDSKDLKAAILPLPTKLSPAGAALKCCLLLRCLHCCPVNLVDTIELNRLLLIFDYAAARQTHRGASQMPQDALIFYCYNQAFDLVAKLGNVDILQVKELRRFLEKAQQGWSALRHKLQQELLSCSLLERLIQRIDCVRALDRIFDPSAASPLSAYSLERQLIVAREAAAYLMSQKPMVISVTARGIEGSELLQVLERSFDDCNVAELRHARDLAQQWLEPLQAEIEFFAFFSPDLESRHGKGSQSILFNHFLEQQLQVRKQSADSATLCSKELASALSEVRRQLQTLLEGRAANFNELKEAGEKLRKERQSPDAELRTIAGFFDRSGTTVQDQVAQTLRGLRSVLQLGQLAGLLLVFVQTLERYQFRCARGDDAEEEFIELAEVAGRLDDEEQMQTVTMGECITLCSETHARLWVRVDEDGQITDDQHSLCVGLLQFFQRLSKADRVWNFVRDQKVFDEDGRVSDFFQRKLLHLQQQVSGAADENLLNQLGSAVQYVSVLASASEKQLSEVISMLRADEHVMHEARRLDDGFLQLAELQKHMSRLEDWFTKGAALSFVPHAALTYLPLAYASFLTCAAACYTRTRWP